MRGLQNIRHPNSFFFVSHLLRMMGRQKSKVKAAVPFVVWKHGPGKLLAVTADLQIHVQLERLSITNAACVNCHSCFQLWIDSRRQGWETKQGRKPGHTGQYPRPQWAQTHPGASLLRGRPSSRQTQTLSLQSTHSCADEIGTIY